jgi:hypothetical protein
MPLFAMIAAVLAAAAAADDDAPIKVLGRPWAPFISPMGEPFRSATVDDDPLARWFTQADRNRDGALTADEMTADAERFFARLDSDRSGEIDPEELNLYETDIAPEVQVNSKWKRPLGAAVPIAAPTAIGDHRKYRERPNRMGRDEVDGYQMHGLQGAARYGLLNLPEPVAGADADFNRGTSLDEFRRAALYRFQLLDSRQAGRLTLAELEPLLPSRPKEGSKVKRVKEARDDRVGQPFPKGN